MFRNIELKSHPHVLGEKCSPIDLILITFNCINHMPNNAYF